MRSRKKSHLPALVFLLLLTGSLLAAIRERSQASVLKEDLVFTEAFREQALTANLYEQIQKAAAAGADFGELFTATMLHGNFYPEEIWTDSRVYRRYKEKEFDSLAEAYCAVWQDLECFPIPDRNISYEDTFGEPRGTNGERTHEGTDLFGEVKKAGYYPVLSMTDGVVEKIGWLPLGGYRIGIRSPSGGYFYYAHLSEYEKDFEEGEHVQAGDILGFMGNTGYGEEGTTGQFPVHLHLGIYIRTKRQEELSVNPYQVLNALGKKIRKYTY